LLGTDADSHASLSLRRSSCHSAGGSSCTGLSGGTSDRPQISTRAWEIARSAARRSSPPTSVPGVAACAK